MTDEEITKRRFKEQKSARSELLESSQAVIDAIQEMGKKAMEFFTEIAKAKGDKGRRGQISQIKDDFSRQAARLIEGFKEENDRRQKQSDARIAEIEKQMRESGEPKTLEQILKEKGQEPAVLRARAETEFLRLFTEGKLPPEFSEKIEKIKNRTFAPLTFSQESDGNDTVEAIKKDFIEWRLKKQKEKSE